MMVSWVASLLSSTRLTRSLSITSTRSDSAGISGSSDEISKIAAARGSGSCAGVAREVTDCNPL